MSQVIYKTVKFGPGVSAWFISEFSFDTLEQTEEYLRRYEYATVVKMDL